jgi:NADPH:quinone reductase-like Zn-dependent oxidoreductase
LKPVVDAVFPAGEVRRALKRMASNASVGKLVLVWENGA